MRKVTNPYTHHTTTPTSPFSSNCEVIQNQQAKKNFYIRPNLLTQRIPASSMYSLTVCIFFLHFLSSNTFVHPPPVSRSSLTPPSSFISPSSCTSSRLSATAEATVEAQHANPSQVKRITTLESFRDELVMSRTENKMLVVKFYAPWCKSCAKINLPFESMSKVSCVSVTFIAASFCLTVSQ